MTFTERQINRAGEPAWTWELEFADRHGRIYKLTSPICFNPGITPEIQADLELNVLNLLTTPYYLIDYKPTAPNFLDGNTYKFNNKTFLWEYNYQ